MDNNKTILIVLGVGLAGVAIYYVTKKGTKISTGSTPATSKTTQRVRTLQNAGFPLKPGSKGKEIYDLQVALKAADEYAGTPNGVWDAATTKALRSAFGVEVNSYSSKGEYEGDLAQIRDWA